MLDNARGGGPKFREMHRALMLADRATREWAATVIADQRPGAPNHFEQLGTLARPEDHAQDARPAADAEVRAAQNPEQEEVARSCQELADAAAELDTEASLAGNTPALRAVGEAAADVLIGAGAIRGGAEFIVEQANRALRDLVAVESWQNQLGPRFE